MIIIHFPILFSTVVSATFTETMDSYEPLSDRPFANGETLKSWIFIFIISVLLNGEFWSFGITKFRLLALQVPFESFSSFFLVHVM